MSSRNEGGGCQEIIEMEATLGKEGGMLLIERTKMSHIKKFLPKQLHQVERAEDSPNREDHSLPNNCMASEKNRGHK